MSEHLPHPPRALVVFESMFGNSEKVARAVARGLESECVDVEVLEVGEAPSSLPDGLALLVVGAPTHAFSLSRPSTRADAVRQGAPASRMSVGVREWLTDCRYVGDGPELAAFDTRMSKVRWLPKAAGPQVRRLGRTAGLSPSGRPVSFLVAGVQGPLVEGELDKAAQWGRLLGMSCASGTVRRVGSA